MAIKFIVNMKYDIVGSFLLPEKLISARREHAAGAIDHHSLLAAEDETILQLVEHQLEAGLSEATSGEFRRNYWDKDFWFGLEGISCERIESGHLYQQLDPFTDLMRFTGRIACNPSHPFFNDFSFLHNACADRIAARQTLPSPANLYLEILTMTDGNPALVYPAPDNLLEDIATAYNRTILHFYEIGCRYLQLDDTACGLLCEDNTTKRLLQGGVDLIALHEQIIRLFNDSIAGLPADMELSLYISGGDTIVPEWEYMQLPDNIMPKILSRVNAGKFFLPFTLGNDRQLEVLSHIPAGKKVVLGLADAHTPYPERTDDILDTIGKASEHIAMADLSVSPKAGFKLSSYASRGLTYADQWAKIAGLAAVAQAAGQVPAPTAP